jgi:molybdopterin molybdotransferase
LKSGTTTEITPREYKQVRPAPSPGTVSAVSTLISVDDALAAVLEHAAPLASETVLLGNAGGRVLAAPAMARVDLPPFASSAMDGFAVRASDTPGSLRAAFRIPAGTPAAEALGAGEAAGIATGAVVPVGADAVVPVENVVDHGDAIEVAEASEPGAHIRFPGGDVVAGAIVVEAGTRLTAPQIGALAAAGIPDVVCAKRPRAVLVATGSELRLPGTELEPGQIFESNRPMVAAVLETAGALVELLEVVPDDEDAHREALVRSLDADVLVTTGGVSVGPHDLVRRVEAELGVEEVFWGVAVKPGKPLSFGVRGETLVFGLPGNPVSSLVGALLFLRPAVLARQGASDPGPRYDVGRAGASLPRVSLRDEYLRARRRASPDGVVLEPVVGQDSHMIVRAASADALVHVPRGSGEIPAGAPVRYLALD